MKLMIAPSQYSLLQSQHWKHQNNMRNMFKDNHRDTKKRSVTSFWSLYCLLTLNKFNTLSPKISGFLMVSGRTEVSPPTIKSEI